MVKLSHDIMVTMYLLRRWNHVVEFIPRWVAPNLITMVGLAINVGTSVLLMVQCSTATEPVRINRSDLK